MKVLWVRMTGAGGSWARRTTVSLMGNFGEVRLGRQKVLARTIVDDFDAFGTTGMVDVSRIYSMGGTAKDWEINRTSNQVAYYLPTMGGFYGGIDLSAGEGSATQATDKMTSARLGYKAGALHLSGAFGRQGVTNKLKTTTVAGSYTLGAATLNGDVHREQAGQPDLQDRHPGRHLHHGRRQVDWFSFAKATFGTKLTAIGYDYSLSKRTGMYAQLARISNPTGKSYALGGATGAAIPLPSGESRWLGRGRAPQLLNTRFCVDSRPPSGGLFTFWFSLKPLGPHHRGLGGAGRVRTIARDSVAPLRRPQSMKKHLFALSALSLASVAALAQSSVQIYGVADAGVSVTTGMLGGTKKHVISGIMDGSRLGFKGTEDMGGGWKALFLLENRIELDTGSNSNVPTSGSQVPDRWGRADLVFSPVSFVGIPGILANGVNAGLQTGLHAVLTTPTTGLNARLAAAAFGVNLGNARFWDRQAYVGLVTPVGAVLMGRQYTPAYELNAVFDIMGTQSSLAAGQVAAVPAVIDIRQSNALQYRIQMDGLTAGFMAAAGEGAGVQGRFYGGQIQYKAGAFAVGLGVNSKKNELGQKSLETKTFGASMDIGQGKLSFLYNDVSDPNPSSLSALLGGLGQAIDGVVKSQIQNSLAANPLLGATPEARAAAAAAVVGQISTASLVNQYKSAFALDATVMSLGYKYVTGPHTIYTAFNRYNDKGRFNADTDSYGAVYSYAFSKRTDMNFVLTHFNNKGMGQAAPGQAGFLGGFTKAAGEDSNNFAIGLRHRF